MSSLEPNSPVSYSAGAIYDEVPYASQSFLQTHPDKLCAMARLFGLNAPDPRTARVLELGCADGSNLLPMAQQLPEAKFVGIDASARQVSVAHATISTTGLSNVEIRHQDILEFSAEGKFDYIIAHGVFSWVPENVRAKILAISNEYLSENGVAYISYNALPGWGMRKSLRDMLLFHTRNLHDPKQKVEQARALTAFLAESVPTEGSPYGMLLSHELQQMKTRPDNFLLHDILGEINDAFYFHDFIGRATRAGLQYLSEPSLDQMLASNFPEKVQATLGRIGHDLIAQEQYMDFVRNRNFRQTLLCRSTVKLDRNIQSELLKGFCFTSVIERPDAAIDFSPGVSCSFKILKADAVLTAENPLMKAAFAVLSNHTVRRVAYTELLHEARSLLGKEGGTDLSAGADEQLLLRNLLLLYSRGVVDIFAGRPEIGNSLAERPEATPLARFQALRSPIVTTRFHIAASPDLIVRHILAACNGQRTQREIADHLGDLVRKGQLQLAEDGKAVTDEEKIKAVLENRVAIVIPRLAFGGYF